jgi:hypothetical protein
MNGFVLVCIQGSMFKTLIAFVKFTMDNLVSLQRLVPSFDGAQPGSP